MVQAAAPLYIVLWPQVFDDQIPDSLAPWTQFSPTITDTRVNYGSKPCD